MNRSNKIKNFSPDEDSINTIYIKTKIENDKNVENERINDDIYQRYKNKEKEIEEAVKDNFPFYKEKNENEIITDLEEEENIRKVLFKTITLKKKRGRNAKNPHNKKKRHSASSPDNILRKIQIHFLNFIIFLLEDIAFSFLKNKKPIFKKFDYEQKKIVNFNTLKELKGLNIRKLIQKFNISSKYSQMELKDNKNINEKNLDILCEYPGFNKFIKQNFLDIFHLYYNNKERLNSIVIGEKEISLSEKTKDFSCLLKKNKQYESELIEIVELVYLNQNIFSVALNLKDIE